MQGVAGKLMKTGVRLKSALMRARPRTKMRMRMRMFRETGQESAVLFIDFLVGYEDGVAAPWSAL